MPVSTNKKLCLVSSSGGHLLEMFSLKSFWAQYERFWVTFPKVDAETILSGEKVYYAFHPTQRNMKNFFKNIILSWQIIRREKPSSIISTGAGVGVPMVLMGKMAGIQTIWIESLTFVSKLSLSGRLVYHVADTFMVQWPELQAAYKRAVYKGQVV